MIDFLCVTSSFLEEKITTISTKVDGHLVIICFLGQDSVRKGWNLIGRQRRVLTVHWFFFFLFLFLSSLLRKDSTRLFHTNYNSRSFRFATSLRLKNVVCVDDGANTILLPLRHESFRFQKKIEMLTTYRVLFDSSKDLDNVNLRFFDLTQDERVRNRDSPIVAVLGGGHVEAGFVRLDSYMHTLVSTVSSISMNSNSIIKYYPHRRQSDENLDLISRLCSQFCQFIVVRTSNCFEDEYRIDDSLDKVFSFSSSIEHTLQLLGVPNKKIFSVRFPPSEVVTEYRLFYMTLASNLAFGLPSSNILTIHNSLLQRVTPRNYEFADVSSLFGSRIPPSDKLDSLDFQTWSGHPILKHRTNYYIHPQLKDLDCVSQMLINAPSLLVGEWFEDI